MITSTLTDYQIRTLEENIARLEHQLEFVRNHPLLGAELYVGQLYIHAGNKETFQEMLVELGNFEKTTNSYAVTAKHRMNPDSEGARHTVEVSLGHEQFCEQVEDGVEVIEEEVYPEDVKPTVIHKEVPKYKWVCPESWLNA